MAKKIKKNFKFMRLKIALVIGQAIGLKCFRHISEEKNIDLKYVACDDRRYIEIVKKICKKKKISFIKKFDKNFIKKKNLESFFLLSILSKTIIEEDVLNKFKDCFNVHPAILPQYPGINPISGMIFNREKKIGVTIHKMTAKVDAGGIIQVFRTSISLKDNLLSCTKKIESLTIKILINFLNKLSKGKKIKILSNNIKKKKLFPKKIPNNGLLNFSWNFDEFLKYFNAGFSGPYSSEWGKLYFNYHKKKKIICNFKILKKINEKKILQIDKKNYSLKLKNKTIIVST